MLKQYGVNERNLLRGRLKKIRESANGDLDSIDNDSEEAPFRKHIHVSEDFPRKVMKCRNDPPPFLIGALKSKQNACLRYDKLIIEQINIHV